MRSIILCIFLLAANISSAQSRKDVRKLKIKSVTEVITETGGKTYNDAFEAFDANGNTVEKTEFRKDGTIKNKVTRLYDKRDNLLEEVIYKSDGSQEKKETFAYDSDNNVIEEKKFGEGNKLEKWLKHEYNALGNKVVETEFDESGNLSKRSEFTYDNNDLRKEKKTYNAKKELIAVKKYTYSY